MNESGRGRPTPVARIIAFLVIVSAILVLAFVLLRSARSPSTDAASIDADVVHVASAVGGRVIRLGVQENAEVKAGDLLFQIDPEPFENTVTQARADLALAEASLETQKRVVATQGSGATMAVDSTRKAEANAALAHRTVERLRPLAAKGYVSQQQFDQAVVAAHDADRTLMQAREQQNAARNAIDTVAGGEAAVQARRAALATAEHALRQTSVWAPHNGRIVGLAVATGEMVAPSQSLFTLIASDEWFSIGNFRETALRDVKVGACATVYSMIDRSRPIKGEVIGIGSGVLDTERVNVPFGLPYVEKSLNWVRVAQRFPVRVKLVEPPEDLVRLGASAIIEIAHGAACR